MTTYYIQENEKLVLYDTDLEKLQNTLLFTPQYQGLEIQETQDLIIDGVIMTQEEYEQRKAEEEKARIQELYMTRSDFFDGTIKAFGLDGDSLLAIIVAYFAQSNDYDELQEKIAINNFKNALNFYRKYPLFNMLSGISLPISETETITITSEQWDKFFNETDKKNPDAYKELLPFELQPSEELAEDIPAEDLSKENSLGE